MSKITNYEDFIKATNDETAKRILLEYLMNVIAKTNKQEMLDNCQLKMTEDELEKFIENIDSRSLTEELNDINNPKYKTIRASKPFPRYLKGVMNTLKYLGYDTEWVDKVLKQELENKFVK